MQAAGPDPWPGGCECGGGDTMNALAANDIEVPRSDQAERRRRLAEPDLEFRAFCSRKGLPDSSTPQLERAWDACQAERYRRGERSQRAAYTDNPFRPR
jgi:hypothetical protein